jgi:hypothetical protein
MLSILQISPSKCALLLILSIVNKPSLVVFLFSSFLVLFFSQFVLQINTFFNINTHLSAFSVWESFQALEELYDVALLPFFLYLQVFSQTFAVYLICEVSEEEVPDVGKEEGV